MNEDSADFDSVLDLCQNHHRRVILGTLIEEQRALTIDDLVKAVLRHNRQTPIREVSEDVLTRIRVSLYHLHLPMLASKELVDYDRERELVEPSERLERIRPTLSAILDADPELEAPMTL